jgi:hypothetical protein
VKHDDHNIAIINALGVTDTKHITEVTLEIKAGRWPVLIVRRFLPDPDGNFITRITKLQLTAAELERTDLTS